MNIPSAFEHMKRVVAEAMAYVTLKDAKPRDADPCKRLLIAGLSQLEGFALSVMGDELGRAEETSRGRFRIVAEWVPWLDQGTPFGVLERPVSALIQDDSGTVVARVLGEPKSGRIWAQGFDEQAPTLIVVSYVRPDTEIVVCRGVAMTPVELAEFIMREDEEPNPASV